MEIKDLKTISISHLILIILNDKNEDSLRKCAENELRKRIRNVDWKYDDLLHFDDKVIKERGLDINHYLISPNVNMQQLMEVYFMYNKDSDFHSNYLLFSEKHLCNEIDFGEIFFRKICSIEINNIDRRLKSVDYNSQRELLVFVKQSLEKRQQKLKQELKISRKYGLVEFLCTNEAMMQLDDKGNYYHEFLLNISKDELDKLLSSKLGTLKANFLEILNETLYDLDIMQYLCGLKFVRNDSAKLNQQKQQLLRQLKSGYEVDYQTISMQKALRKHIK